jgi:hypothetical protein
MRAVKRVGIAILVTSLWLGAAPTLAQSGTPPTTNTPASDAIGPRELQNFSINGTVTRPADTPAPRSPARPPAASAPTATARTAPARERIAQAQAEPRPAAPAAPSANPLDLGMPAAPAASVGAAQSGFTSEPQPLPPAIPAPEPKGSLLPWLLAAVALGAGAAFLFYRRQRSRPAYAGGEEYEAYAAPEAPAPPPIPRPAPKPTAPSRPPGVVSSNLRPWLDIEFEPIGCLVEADAITVEFNVHLFNSGSAPARKVLVEASMFNAGPGQEEDIAAFFGRPVAQGERIAEIPPLRRMTLRSSVVAPRANVREVDLGGRPAFVPLLAFNALYRLSGREAQTSTSYLLGRETRSDKLAPLRLDGGPRAITGLGARPLPNGVRN